MTATDDQLLIRIRNNDYTGFNQLFHRYYGRLCQFAAHYVSDRETAEDLVQDLFMRLWADRKKLIIRERLSSYLFKATRNACLNQIRADKSRRELPGRIGHPDFAEQREWLEEEEFISYLNDCINQLPERSRQVFIMSRIEEQKLDEITEKLGVSVKTIKNQLWKSMQFLKSCMELKRVF